MKITEVMKAVTYSKYGLPENLKLVEVEKPEPGENEVLVKIHAVSINSWDLDLLRGKPLLTRLGGLFNPKYSILGCDIAGVVEDFGSNVTDFSIGDKVFGDLSGCGWGGLAEFVCADQSSLCIMPRDMSFEQAASIPQAGVLALQGLQYKKEIRKGDKVLINGAGGGVGTFALQIAKFFGAEVTCVDRYDKLELLKNLGADFVMDYNKCDFAESELKYDRVIDVTAARSLRTHSSVLEENGLYIIIGGTTSAILRTLIWGSFISQNENKLVSILIHTPNKNLDILSQYFSDGIILPVIDSTYPLSRTEEAFNYFLEGNVKGKIVINV